MSLWFDHLRSALTISNPGTLESYIVDKRILYNVQNSPAEGF